MGGRTDIQEHLNRISQAPGSSAAYMQPPSGLSGMPKGPPSRQQTREGGMPDTAVGRIETAEENKYALVPKRDEDDLLVKTYQSFKLQQEAGMSQEEADEFQKMQNQQRETQYMATNPQLIMKGGRFDEKSAEYGQFKR